MEVGEGLRWLRPAVEEGAEYWRDRVEKLRAEVDRAERELGRFEALLRGYWVL